MVCQPDNRVKGPSGSGKSFALAAGLNFVPEDAYELYHGMSEKALIYNTDLDLRHRYLIIQEAAGLNRGDGRVFIRQLLSEGKVRYATVQSTQDGLIGKDLPSVEGPAGLIMTTTENALHPEDESRMLSVHMDESRERTKAILAVQAGAEKKSKYAPDYGIWHALHRLAGCGPFEVTIPFAAELAERLPVDHFRIDRDFPQVLSLIRAHTLLHQCTRNRNSDGALLATVDDYTEVYRLIADPLAQGLEATVADNIRQVVEGAAVLIAEDEKNSDSPWSHKPINLGRLADHIGRDRSVVSRNVAAAIEAGYLVNDTPGQGREATLKLGDRQLPSGSVLPRPDQLKSLRKAA